MHECLDEHHLRNVEAMRGQGLGPCFKEIWIMTYNTIMVQFDIDAPIAPRLDFAWDIARRYEAGLIGFAAAEPFLLMPGEMDGGATGEAMRLQIEEIEDRLKALKSEFETLTRDSNRASWRGMLGNPTRFLALNARAADLIVTGTDGDEARSRLRTVDPGELILSAGRPILFASKDQRPMTAESILVAWKDTRESRRAVVDAMPFLVAARHVLVATIVEDDRVAARDSVADVVRFLMKHGVKARSEVLDADKMDASEALLTAANQTGADLVVAGGYGHSRLREWAFGGVTRTLIEESSTNRLLAN
ncbi:MAG: universal stress protein [Rhizobiaceae bacterium]